MASTTVEVHMPTGLTLTLKLYPYGSDTIANGAGGDTMTERTNAKGVYSATVTEAITGWHDAIIEEGGTAIAALDLHLADDTGTYRCHDAARVRGTKTLLDDLNDLAATAITSDGSAITMSSSGVIGTVNLVNTTTTNTDMITAAAVNAEVDTALVDAGLDHLVSAAVTGTDVTDNSIIAKLVSKSATADWDDFVNTTDSLQAIRDNGDSAWATATGFSTHAAADVWTSVTRTLTAATNITSDGSAITMSSSGVVGTVNVVNTTTTNTDMLTAAAVNAEVDTALADINLDHLVKNPVDTDFITTVDEDSVIGWLAHDGTGTGTGGGGFNRTTDSLEAIADGGSSLTAADVWTYGTRVLTAATNITSDGAAINTTAGVVDTVTTVSSVTTVNGLAANTITASAIATDAIGASELAADAANEIADAILTRDVDNVESTANEHTLCTIILAALESSISGTTWTIKRTDGSTTHASKTVASSSSANPITSVS